MRRNAGHQAGNWLESAPIRIDCKIQDRDKAYQPQNASASYLLGDSIQTNSPPNTAAIKSPYLPADLCSPGGYIAQSCQDLKGSLWRIHYVVARYVKKPL